MTPARLPEAVVTALRARAGNRLHLDEPLAKHTSARIGGPADALVVVRSVAELADIVGLVWQFGLPMRILGGGSNVLVADAGVRGVVILNQARGVHFPDRGGVPFVRAESGASLGGTARLAVEKGLSGLEWATTVPGTVGGAIVGNAGAHGGDVSGSLEAAEILQRGGSAERWPAERLHFAYRGSWLKDNPGQAVVLSADFRLARSTPEETKARAGRFVEHRQATQPPGASWGSMFKNPSGDYAGRLVEAAGLKGARQGDVEVSTLHGNFFINHGAAKAADAWGLIRRVQQEVETKFGVRLALEVELVGEWEAVEPAARNGRQD